MQKNRNKIKLVVKRTFVRAMVGKHIPNWSSQKNYMIQLQSNQTNVILSFHSLPGCEESRNNIDNVDLIATNIYFPHYGSMH